MTALTPVSECPPRALPPPPVALSSLDTSLLSRLLLLTAVPASSTTSTSWYTQSLEGATEKSPVVTDDVGRTGEPPKGKAVWLSIPFLEGKKMHVLDAFQPKVHD